MFIDETSDGGFIISGRTANPDSKNCDSYLIKIASFENQRPTKPTIEGPNKGKPGESYVFTAISSDPEGTDLTYMWDWGDGNYSGWLTMNEKAKSYNTEDVFKIKVKVKDEDGGESEWSEPFSFSTPKNKQIKNYMDLLEYLLHQLLKYMNLRI
jgi:hypothetical protein